MFDNKIKKVAFIYLTQKAGEYYITDDEGYSVQRRPQLGLQYLCAVLEKRGISTDLFDQTVNFFDIERLINRLKNYDLAGFYCSDSQKKNVKNYCQEIKKKLNIPILVGGPSTFRNSDFLNYNCDIVVHGEGERTIEEIIDYYEGRISLDNIKGISFKRDGEIITAQARTLIENLDELPFPDRSKIDVNEYYDWFFIWHAEAICYHGCFSGVF